MKYIAFIILFFSILLLGTVVNCMTESGEMEIETAHSFQQKYDGHYASKVEFPVLYGMEQEAGRFFSSFRSNWMQARQDIIERTVMKLKRIIFLVSLRNTVLVQQQYTLFNYSFQYSKRSCSIYYVYDIRHIII